MQVLLLQDVEGLGHAGDVKKVADGYARNYLIPRLLALPATPGSVKAAEQAREAKARKQARVQSEAQALAQLVDGQSVAFQARAGEGDRLYGSITNANIAEALQAKVGREIDKRKIELDEPIKELGAHTVTIRFAPQAEAKVIVVVERGE